jgi:hypothetical protein
MLEFKKQSVIGELVNQVSNNVFKKKNIISTSNSDKPKNKCWKCGGSYPHDEGKMCPASDKCCNICKKKGHFAKMCKNKNQNNFQNDKLNQINKFLSKYDSDSEDYAWSIGSTAKIPTISLEIAKSKIKFAVDTGATINIMDRITFNSLYLHQKLMKSSTKAFTYGSHTPLNI